MQRRIQEGLRPTRFADARGSLTVHRPKLSRDARAGTVRHHRRPARGCRLAVRSARIRRRGRRRGPDLQRNRDAFGVVVLGRQSGLLGLRSDSL